jgi:hypothetical protein
MEALWLIPIAILAVGGWFMVKAFIRLAGAMQQMRESLQELGEMAPRLQRLGEDMSALNEALAKRQRVAPPPPPPEP